MAFFNPFIGSSQSGGGSTDTVRYSIEKIISNDIITYKLKQTLNGESSYVGDIISFDASNINFNSEWANTIEEALTYLYNIINTTDIKSIKKIEFTSSTGGVTPAIEGATDTYTITYTDDTTFTYQIQNGNKGSDGITPKFKVTDTTIQVSTDNGLTYTDLILLSEITGAAGQDGIDGITPILRATESAIQVSTDNGTTYTDLIQLANITGKDGLSIAGAIINTDGHLILTLSDNSTIDAGEAKGKDGTSVKIKNTLSSTDDLPTTGNINGDGYLIDGYLWIYTETTITDEKNVKGFTNVGKIQGPKGVDGVGISSIESVLTDDILTALKINYSNNTSNTISVGNIKGEKGEDGISVVSIDFTSSTLGDTAGITGATDTYTITFSNDTTKTFIVKNGEKGDVSKVRTLNYNLASVDWNESTITISSEYITSENYISIGTAKNITLEAYNALGKAKLICSEQSKGKIVLKALGEVPTVNIPIVLVIEGEQIDNIATTIVLTDETTGKTYSLGIDNSELFIK